MKSVHPALPEAPGPAFRSGAVARLANMPVATLRIWEQRYRAVRPATAASGHRLYSPADVQRVLLLRELTVQGHAIGSIAALDTPQLQRVAQQASLALDVKARAADPSPARVSGALRVVVVGPALAERLKRASVMRHLTQPAQLVAVFESLAQAARADRAMGADLLLWHAPELLPDVPPELRWAQQAWSAARIAVVYRFAGSAAIRSLGEDEVATVREPADDESLGLWLGSMEADLSQRAVQVAKTMASEAPPPTSASSQVSPRRYDDAVLTTIAGMSPTLACECPRHVAELLMQLASFEAYSAGCVNRDPADAELHAYLEQVAGVSRALFEAALERVARHEGLQLR